MPNILPPVSERDNSHGRILDPSQHWLESGIHIAQQSARHLGGRGQHQTFRDSDLLAACLTKPHFEPDRSCLAPSTNSKHLRTEAPPRTNSLSKRTHQRLIAATKAEQGGPLTRSFPRPCRPHHSANCAACRLLRLIQLRKCRAQTDSFRIPRVDP